MKILLIGNYYYPEHIGGVEVVSYNLVRHYRAAGQVVQWMAADVPPRFRLAGEDDIPIRAWNLAEEKLGFPSPLPFPSALPAVHRAVRDCDIVHLQDCLYPLNILAFFLAKRFGKPVLITQYAKIIPYQQRYKRILQSIGYATFGKWMFKTADNLVFITRNVRDSMRYLNPTRNYPVLLNGVDTDFFLPAEPARRVALREGFAARDKPILLFVGRMVERKGIRLLKEVVSKHPEWHWVMVGRPDDENPAVWGSENISYFPSVPIETLRDFYAAADLLVHPSSGEGLTLTAMECMSCGTPVLISEESAYEILPEHLHAFFTIQPNSGAIEAALTAILSEPAKLAALRETVRAYILRQLSWQRVAGQYLDLLEQVWSGRARQGSTR
jgi:glycosyltransferase involved in cell wall biosynthesis